MLPVEEKQENREKALEGSDGILPSENEKCKRLEAAGPVVRRRLN